MTSLRSALSGTKVIILAKNVKDELPMLLN